eukprot:scaffold106_cov380-Prasinococcus_capsulatus_cf.AAC.45
MLVVSHHPGQPYELIVAHMANDLLRLLRWSWYRGYQRAKMLSVGERTPPGGLLELWYEGRQNGPDLLTELLEAAGS